MENENSKHTTEDENFTNKRRKIEVETQKVIINGSYVEPNFIKTLSEGFCKKKELYFENGAKIISNPFTCCVLPDFLQPKEFTENLKEEIEEIEVELKLSDLYQFKQSKDLSTCTDRSISLLRDMIYGAFLEWMKRITNIPLNDKVDISCSCYTHTDHLLCHDDELEGRRIAYIYYLVPEWEKEYGGRLDLFNMVNGSPADIATSFIPEWNNLIFFEVSPVSYHQVSEITAYKTRTSISGWFYGPPMKRNVRPTESILFQSPSSIPVDILQWINPTYLEPESQTKIRHSFEESSEIELLDFFQEEKYEEICSILNSNCIKWQRKGPPCRRNYEEIVNIDEMPTIVKECQALFCSEPFLLILSNITGLRLHPACSEERIEMAEVNTSIRKWSPGSYTLLHDQSFFEFPTLNVGLCFNCSGWDIEHGGFTSYVAKDEYEELLRVDPKQNTLALVYITEETSNFVKYINCRATECPNPCFQDIFLVYCEKE